MPKITAQSRIEAVRKRFSEDYDLSTLNNSNDRATLETVLRNIVILEDLQERQLELMAGDISQSAAEIKKIGDLIKATAETNLSLERSLGIDRKSRKTEDNAESPAEYIRNLKAEAKKFLEQRLIKVYCDNCKVMVMRFAPVHDHTKFDLKCQCSQCKKIIRVHREEKDVLFDLPAKDRPWRAKYPVEVVQSKQVTTDAIDTEEDEMIIGGGE